MALMPFVFVGRPKGTTFSDIDGSIFAQYLRNMTASTELTHSEDGHVPCEPSWVWMEGSASRLHHATISSHITSLIQGNGLATPGAAVTSWSSMCIASQLYSYSVLGLFGRSEPLEWRLLRRYLALLAQDIDKGPGKKSDDLSDIGLWKGFVGAYAIATHQTFVYDRFMEEIESTFKDFICRWAVATGVIAWEEVRSRLAKTAWPSNMPSDLGPEVWMRATQL